MWLTISDLKKIYLRGSLFRWWICKSKVQTLFWFESETNPTDLRNWTLSPDGGAVRGSCGTFKRWRLAGRSRCLRGRPWGYSQPLFPLLSLLSLRGDMFSHSDEKRWLAYRIYGKGWHCLWYLIVDGNGGSVSQTIIPQVENRPGYGWACSFYNSSLLRRQGIGWEHRTDKNTKTYPQRPKDFPLHPTS